MAEGNGAEEQGTLYIEACTEPGGSECAYVEYQQTLFPELSVTDATAIGGAILLCWAVAYGVAVVVRTLSMSTRAR